MWKEEHKSFPATFHCWFLLHGVIIPAPFMHTYPRFVVTGSVCGWVCKENVGKYVKPSPQLKTSNTEKFQKLLYYDIACVAKIK